MTRCAFCAETIQDGAQLCRYCNRPVIAIGARPTVAAEPSGVSVARTIAKTIHFLVLGWTGFCVVNTLTAIGRMSRASGLSTGSTDAAGALGITIGIGFWAVLWFLPVVAGEAIAIGLSVSAKKSPAIGNTATREWVIAFVCAAPINLLLALGAIVSLPGVSAALTR